MNKHNINELENMIINILEEDEKEVWQNIEKISNAFKRCEKRKLFAQAINKIQREK